MGEKKSQSPEAPQDLSPPSSSEKRVSEMSNGTSGSGPKISYRNPPDPVNPDPATLREQWRYATRQYSKWYSHAWGTAILAGVSFFALGWIIKGSNPLPSVTSGSGSDSSSSSSSSSGRDERK